jgi:UDP-N-acetylglucosamine--N-acetylmuramyl-(pentapeptide) pyrophosphoryl-undecaprenol N-acetylglucosamine transferase
MRLLVTGGGTGGHVYPALAVIEALAINGDLAAAGHEVAWVGTSAGVEQQLVSGEKLPFYSVSAGALRGMSPRVAIHSILDMLSGYRQARSLVRSCKPDVTLSTGGYVSVPLVLAARSLGCPVMIYLPDIEPGLAVRFLSLFAQRVAVSFPESLRWFARDQAFASGYPVRRALYTTDKTSARRALGLSTKYPALLVFGGSRGAHSINRVVQGNLASLLEVAELVHVSGYADYDGLAALREQLPEAVRSRYHLEKYLHEHMVDALLAADLAVARAGAATLGEFPAAGLPAILVPYPYSGQHQYANAKYLAQKGAAVIVNDDQLSSRLVSVISELLTDRQRLQSMSAVARACAVPDAARRIGCALIELAGQA